MGAMMNFFQHQHQARSSTRRLIILFVLAVLAIVAAVDLAVLLAMPSPLPDDTLERVASINAQQTRALWIATILTLAIIGFSSLYRIAALRGGGAKVAQGMGGTLVASDTTEPGLRRLRNVVEEIAIASASPVPEIYVMDGEEGINAFAAGYSSSDAVIAVTRGALNRLNRDELQAVIAHEFSHILNGDMRLNIRLMGVLFGILVLGIIGREVLLHVRGGRDSRGVLVVMLAALVLTVVGYIGVFFGRLIKAGISRSRERLADASAVQFTRQTEGLAGALKKIAGLNEGSRLGNARTEEVSHMLFGEGMGFSSWFATHPPILERIKAVDPSFNPKEFDSLKARWIAQPPSALDEDLALGFAADGSRLDARANLIATQTTTGVTPEAIAAQVGVPDRSDVACAQSIDMALSDNLQNAARRQDQAMAVVLALLVADASPLRERQFHDIETHLDGATAAQVRSLWPEVARLHPMARLPLASLAFPLLRRRPRPELGRFLACCEALIAVDGSVSLFEYCLGRLLRRQTVEALDPARYAPSGRRKLAQVREQVETVLAVLANQGHDSALEAQRAYGAGIEQMFPGQASRYQPPTDFVAALEASLSELDDVEPMGKALLIEGLVATIGTDGKVCVAEAELLRTLCAVLHCPLPPMLKS